jgi:hypothetical protein
MSGVERMVGRPVLGRVRVLAVIAAALGAFVVAPTGGLLHANEAAAMAPGSCGSVLLPGTDWLDGGGVNVYSNGSDEGTLAQCGGTSSVGGAESGEEWQCVELPDRLYLTKGWISRTWEGNAGYEFFNDAPPGPGGVPLLKQRQGSITYVGPGDVIDILLGKDGHVFVDNDPGPISNGVLHLVSQNSGTPSDADPEHDATISDGSVHIAGGDYTVVGVIHAPNPLPTSTALESSLDPAELGQEIVLFARAVAGSTYGESLISSGLMTFAENGHVLASVPVDNGQAAISLSNFPVGHASFTASFQGGGYIASRSQPLTQMIQVPFAVTSAGLPGAVLGQPYTAKLTAQGGTKPYTWKLLGGSLPVGLSLSPDGTITGTPSQIQASAFTVELVDSGELAQTQLATFSIRVAKTLRALMDHQVPHLKHDLVSSTANKHATVHIVTQGRRLRLKHAG